jgi:riboflavin biosynthesis pyrimidine reductase
MLLSFDLRALALLFAGLMCRPDETTVAGPQPPVLSTCYISDAIASAPLTLKHLLPATADQIVAGFGLDELPPPASTSRPHVILNMVSTADGHATLDGRSGPLSGPADRALFHALRLAVDAVMAGAATVRLERYGRIVPDASRRQMRVAQGRSEEPLACIVSGRLALEGDIPLLADPAAHVVILTPSSASLPAGAANAELDYIRAARDGRLDLAAALVELRARFDVHTLLCEGGPHLNAQLLAAGLVDELFLSLSPLLAGGDPPNQNPADPGALRILAGPELSPPVALELRGVLEHDSGLFMRYGVRSSAPAERVSRETIPSSSLAR